MRRLTLVAALIALVAMAMATAAAGKPDHQRNFSAHLNGGNENPANDSAGQGQANFKLSKDGDSMSFKLIASNIDGVTMAHIHCGSPDVNGPVTVFLFGPMMEGVDSNGVLSQGTITAGNVIPLPDSMACPGGIADFDDLIAKMRSGGAYVNVHTLANPPGEIRGAIK